MAIGMVGFVLCLMSFAIWYSQFGGSFKVDQISEGESLTLMVGQQMKIFDAHSSSGLMYAGKLPDSKCGRLVAYGRDGVGLWVYEGRQFMVEGMVLLVEVIGEESITIRLAE